jgi:glycosyltransferase involved in cell wall biosynthesis
MTPTCPLVTCMTVSQPPRLRHLTAAIQDFCAQSWPRRELVIVLDDPEYSREVQSLIKGLDGNIRVLDFVERAPLGKLRNMALEYANGELICQWDDDDRYSAQRLELQAEAVLDSGASACFLYQQLHYFETTRQLFWTDWRLWNGVKNVRPPSCWIPGTVLFRRGRLRYPERGMFSSRGEDSALTFALWRENAIAIETPPGTYLRNFHGNNTWGWKHHSGLAHKRSQDLSTVCAWRADLEDAARRFGLGNSISLMAGREIAFRI